MAIESLWMLIIVIVAAQISLVLITVIDAVEYLWLLIIAVEVIHCRDHKIGILLRFYFTCPKYIPLLHPT